MKVLRFRLMGIFLLTVGTCVAGPVLADEPMPITANQAFGAFARQIDPVTRKRMRVALVDVRSRAEFYWVGTATKVEQIVLKDGSIIVPDYGKVRLDHEGKFLIYKLKGRQKRVGCSSSRTTINQYVT